MIPWDKLENMPIDATYILCKIHRLIVVRRRKHPNIVIKEILIIYIFSCECGQLHWLHNFIAHIITLKHTSNIMSTLFTTPYIYLFSKFNYCSE